MTLALTIIALWFIASAFAVAAWAIAGLRIEQARNRNCERVTERDEISNHNEVSK
jgi:hypothetical protein